MNHGVYVYYGGTNLVKKTSNEKKNITPSPTKYEIGNVLGNTICLLTQVTCSTISLFSLLLTSSAEHFEIYKLHQKYLP